MVGATLAQWYLAVPSVLYQTVELRFYNIITTINTIFLESLGGWGVGLVGFDGLRDREGLRRRALGLAVFLGERPGGRGDRSPVVFERSYQAYTRTVELRFYNIITTTNPIILESLPITRVYTEVGNTPPSRGH